METQEIKRQADRVKEQAQNLTKCCNQIIKLFGNLKNCLKDDANSRETTDLIKSISQFQNTYINIYSNAKRHYDELSDKMLKYVNETEKNATNTADTIMKSTSAIDGMLSTLGSSTTGASSTGMGDSLSSGQATNNDAPKIYTDWDGNFYPDGWDPSTTGASSTGMGDSLSSGQATNNDAPKIYMDFD